MESSIRISELADRAPSAALRERILARIVAMERRAALWRTTLMSSCTAIASLCLLETLQYASNELYFSGFLSYARLAFLDGGAALSRELMLSLAESFPALPIALACLFAALVLWSGMRTRSAFFSLRHARA